MQGGEVRPPGDFYTNKMLNNLSNHTFDMNTEMSLGVLLELHSHSSEIWSESKLQLS